MIHLSQEVLDLERDKTAQAKEIAILKKRVTKLEQRQSFRAGVFVHDPWELGLSNGIKGIGHVGLGAQGHMECRGKEWYCSCEMQCTGEGVRKGWSFGGIFSYWAVGVLGMGRKGSFSAEKEVSTVEPVFTAGAAITTASVDVSPASPTRRVCTVDDITIAETLVYIKRSVAKDKGKGIMTESEPVQTKTKLQQEQERLSYEAAVRLQEELDEEERQRMARSEVDKTLLEFAAGSSKRGAEEELDQGSSKRQKTGESSKLAEEPRDKDANELSQEELQQMMIIVEREYPLSKGVLTQMLGAKLLVEQDNEMSRELLRKIFMQGFSRCKKFNSKDLLGDQDFGYKDYRQKKRTRWTAWQRNKESVSLLQTAIDEYHEDDANHLNTLEQLNKFKASENPFSNEFLASFRSVCGKQATLLNKLRTRTVEVVKKLDSVKTWRRLSNVIFVTTFSTVLICSVVAAVVAAPALVAALAAAATLVPLGSMGTWVDSLWQKYEKELRYHKNTMNVMKVQSDVFVIKDLENIKAIVDRMEIKMDGMMKSADFVIGEGVEEAVGIGVDEIKNPVKEFARLMDDLSDQSVKSISDIKRATRMILEKLNEHPRITG
nr:uncharacterized protein [Tanacetum cinerariifolium]